MDRSVEFFESQFRRQVREGEFALNPFERSALPHVRGTVLDLGCGLGNLAVEAARRGCRVVARDASATAIERLRQVAAAERLPIDAACADLADYRIGKTFDSIVSIGLLMFFRRPLAEALLREIQRNVAPGGVAVVNVLIEGTTFMEMFDPGGYTLFRRMEVQDAFANWEILESRFDRFDAPGKTVKAFSTVIARKPAHSKGGSP